MTWQYLTIQLLKYIASIFLDCRFFRSGFVRHVAKRVVVGRLCWCLILIESRLQRLENLVEAGVVQVHLRF